MKSSSAVIAIGALLLLPLFGRADVLTLKSGGTVEGSVIKYGNQYRVKTADGQTRVIPEADVVSVNKSGTGAASPTSPGVSGNFNATRTRADAVDAPIVAVIIWEKFIDANPGSADLSAAKGELTKWQKLNADDAERINGKWVSGDDRRKLLSDVRKLCTTARNELENQTVDAIDKYEQALKLYPNCFEANFALGYFHLRKGAGNATQRPNMPEIDRAIKSLETAVKLRPNSASALSNLAIGYNLRDRFEEAVLTADKAVRIRDSKEVVENLLSCIRRAPPGMRSNNQKVKAIMAESSVLASKYGLSADGDRMFHYITPEPVGTIAGDSLDREGRPGVLGNGSGFVVTADGYILTNRHVVEGKNRIFRVRFEDGREKNAEAVAVDEQCDVALIKIKPDKSLDYLKLAATDLPNPAARCMVLGYPVADLLDFKMQVSSGEVSSTNKDDEYQITLTGNTTHGNSGGPIVDRDGNVMGILSAGATAFNVTYLKALSAGQVRGFLDRAKSKYTATFEPGKSSSADFDGEKLAQSARKSTVLVLIIRGDGKDTAAGD